MMGSAVMLPPLASFAQFGSDLDKETKAQLAKGERIVEMLKQNQYSPMKVEDQVLIIFAVSNNFCNDIEVSDMKRFEKELVEFANLSHADVLRELKTTSKFDKELMDRTAEVINEFKLTFKPGAPKEN